MFRFDGLLKRAEKVVVCPAASPPGMAIKPVPTLDVALTSVMPAGSPLKPIWMGPAIAELLVFVTVMVPLKLRVTRL